MSRKNIKILAVLDNLSKVLESVDAQLDETDCPLKTKMQVDVAVEELFVNIANYAYVPDTGDADILIEIMDSCPIPEDCQEDISDIDRSGNWLRVTLSDSGTPFNPLLKEDPDVTLSAQDRRIGGLGIFMVKKSMDYMYYEFKDGKNNISICKKLS
ncbi:MAG: ATP-binding protein [Lachnospiraceae bacterium]|nr:ATP-binding protein [Lachnospiraceae bacterium]